MFGSLLDFSSNSQSDSLIHSIQKTGRKGPVISFMAVMAPRPP
ncbi:hypothetical protein MRBBS_0037 [Marinobacter sp. BSs20148]|nr:hypothetical protein MRBBS_0037 [Marinobacter sp. BSs20148]